MGPAPTHGGFRGHGGGPQDNQSGQQRCRDPDAMDVDLARLSKTLSNEEMAKLKAENRCFYCKKVGHAANKCYTKKRDQEAANKQNSEVKAAEATSEPSTNPPSYQVEAGTSSSVNVCSTQIRAMTSDQRNQLFNQLMTDSLDF